MSPTQLHTPEPASSRFWLLDKGMHSEMLYASTVNGYLFFKFKKKLQIMSNFAEMNQYVSINVETF